MATTKPTLTRIATVGRRKRAIARIRLTAGKGIVTINDVPATDDFASIYEPLTMAGLTDKVDITVKVLGGGVSGQLGAIRHGIARAAIQFDPESKTTLKKAGFLTRDPREKERKKPGLKRARRAPQWAKR
ncbi:30S ribosomal protein S9 [Candidatus Berkelbacteria bacterium]|nr:30S ribosomal protein S9 [Candidatus Berkelbacteria bacterium]